MRISAEDDNDILKCSNNEPVFEPDIIGTQMVTILSQVKNSNKVA